MVKYMVLLLLANTDNPQLFLNSISLKDIQPELIHDRAGLLVMVTEDTLGIDSVPTKRVTIISSISLAVGLVRTSFTEAFNEVTLPEVTATGTKESLCLVSLKVIGDVELEPPAPCLSSSAFILASAAANCACNSVILVSFLSTLANASAI